jgi:hypothetical protein
MNRFKRSLIKCFSQFVPYGVFHIDTELAVYVSHILLDSHKLVFQHCFSMTPKLLFTFFIGWFGSRKIIWYNERSNVVH